MDIITDCIEYVYDNKGLHSHKDYTTDELKEFVEGLTEENYKKLEDYVDTCTRIRDIIANQKFEGAAVGAYNANLISRDLGLVEKSNTTIAIEQPMFPDESKPKE